MDSSESIHMERYRHVPNAAYDGKTARRPNPSLGASMPAANHYDAMVIGGAIAGRKEIGTGALVGTGALRRSLIE